MRKLCFCILFLLGYSNPLLAAKNEEVVYTPGLLILGGLSQSISAAFTRSGTSNKNFTKSRSNTNGAYSLSTIAAILDPDLVTIYLDGSLSYRQSFNEDANKNIFGLYNINTNLFRQSFYPVTVSSSRSQVTVTTSNKPTLTIINNDNQISGSLLNQFLPVRFSYRHGTSEASDFASDSTSTSDSFSLNVSHQYKAMSITSLTISMESSAFSQNKSSGQTAGLSNSLVLDSRHRYILGSHVQIAQARADNFRSKDFNLLENLDCKFGEALKGRLDVKYDANSSGESEKEQEKKRSSLSASLSHTLFRSLTSSFSGMIDQSSLLGGTSNTYGGIVGITYNKKLPLQNTLNLSGNYSKMLSIQKLKGSQVSGFRELHAKAQIFQKIKPDIEGLLVAVTNVEVVEPDLIALGRLEPKPFLDYEVNYIEGTITLGGTTIPDSNIYITYTVAVNTDISFVTDSKNISGSVTAFKGILTVSGSFSNQGQRMVSGNSQNAPLSSSSSHILRADTRLNDANIGLEYGFLSSTNSKNKYYKSSINYKMNLSPSSVLSFNALDIFTTYLPTEEVRRAYDQNVMSLGASYQKTLSGSTTMSLSASFSDTKSHGRTSNRILISGRGNATFGNLVVSLSGAIHYLLLNKAVTNMDNNATVTVTRYF